VDDPSIWNKTTLALYVVIDTGDNIAMTCEFLGKKGVIGSPTVPCMIEEDHRKRTAALATGALSRELVGKTLW